MAVRDILARNLVRLRREKRMSQEELAHQAGLDRTSVSRIERRLNAANIDLIEAIADALGVEPGELLARESRSPRAEPADSAAASIFAAIGTAVRRERLSKGMTQDELATRMGVKRPFLARLESGRHNTSVTTLASAARALEVPLSNLFDVDADLARTGRTARPM